MAIVTRALAKRPEDRYPSAGDMASDLRVAMGEPARLSTPVPVVPPAWRDGGSDSTSPGSVWGRALLAAAVLVVLLLGATRLFSGRRGADALRKADGRASVAILPLETRGTSVEDEYLSEGLREEIADRLEAIRGLKVISPSSVVALKGRKLTVQQVADTLGVRHVLDGSLERTGERIEARVQLIEASSGKVVWQQTYRLGADELLQLQDVIARQVAGALSTAGGRMTMPASPVRTVQAAAYDAYLKGSYWLERRTPEALQHATSAFQEAIDLDPNYPQALAGLASAHTYAVIYGYRSEADPYSELAEALQLADRAVARDSTAGEAYHARADARSIAFYPEDSVRADVVRARRLKPNSADVRMAYAWALFRAGRGDSAIAQARRALALDPLAPGIRHSLVALAIGARRYDIALREVRPAGSGAAADPVSTVLEAYAQLLSGQAARCADRDLGPWVALARHVPVRGRTVRARPPRSPIRSPASSTRSTTRSSTSMPTSRPTTPGAATRDSRCTGSSAPSPIRRCCTGGSSSPACSTRCGTGRSSEPASRAPAAEAEERLRARRAAHRGVSVVPPPAEFRCDVPTAELLGRADRRSRCRSA